MEKMIISCNKNIGDEGEREFDKQVLYEIVRNDRLKDTLRFFKENIEMKSYQISMLSKLKEEDEKNNRDEFEDVLVEYKLGMLDPGRRAATIEKQSRMRKLNLFKILM